MWRCCGLRAETVTSRHGLSCKDGPVAVTTASSWQKITLYSIQCRACRNDTGSETGFAICSFKIILISVERILKLSS